MRQTDGVVPEGLTVCSSPVHDTEGAYIKHRFLFVPVVVVVVAPAIVAVAVVVVSDSNEF